MTRPPYEPPRLMADLGDVEANGLSVVSTFSGCGGSCLGFRLAGYRIRYAVEFVPAARETYLANFPDALVDDRDIRAIRGAEILAAIGADRGAVDVLEGSPPCSSFSSAGSVAKGWGRVKAYSDTRQRTDDLFDEYVRLVGEILPRAFVAENVTGLAKGASIGYFRRVLADLRAKGYAVAARVLDAQWLGVPQARCRIVIIGVRSDLEAAPRFPRPLPYRYSIGDALAGVVVSPAEAAEVSIERFAIGRAWRAMPIGGGARYFSLVKPPPTGPLPTLTQTASNIGAAGVTHWAECRKFTTRELRRLCGFPDDFILTGDYQQQAERLGRAVPPPLMAAVASTLAGVLA